ncbi:MAG TPA: hypothetical protein VF789_11145 [Thermoanaerobaculia bacterium]
MRDLRGKRLNPHLLLAIENPPIVDFAGTIDESGRAQSWKVSSGNWNRLVGDDRHDPAIASGSEREENEESLLLLDQLAKVGRALSEQAG